MNFIRINERMIMSEGLEIVWAQKVIVSSYVYYISIVILLRQSHIDSIAK